MSRSHIISIMLKHETRYKKSNGLDSDSDLYAAFIDTTVHGTIVPGIIMFLPVLCVPYGLREKNEWTSKKSILAGMGWGPGSVSDACCGSSA